MKVDVTEISRAKNSSRISTAFRSILKGPEAALLKRFLKDSPLSVERGTRLTVFREPRLESGFPDVVIVAWKPSIARKWDPRRRKLDTGDLRLMDYLFRVGGVIEDEIADLLGKRALQRLEKLRNAGCIKKAGGKWCVRSLTSIFAATEIIAIEAKVGNPKRVLSQAQMNTWFASRSYILTPNPGAIGFQNQARRLGIGVCAFAETPKIIVRSRKRKLPRSYASWLFNEWVCSTAYRRKEL